MKSLVYILFFCFLVQPILAQQTPALPQQQEIAIVGATAHLGNGTVIENSFIAFENGKLTVVADGRLVKPVLMNVKLRSRLDQSVDHRSNYKKRYCKQCWEAIFIVP